MTDLIDAHGHNANGLNADDAAEASAARAELDPTREWHKTACILCSANCGVEVRLDGRIITRVRGNKAHVSSKGYTCEKALRLNHYQNARGRLSSPMKQMPDGTFVEVDWDTAIAEIAAGFKALIAEHGGDKIMYSSAQRDCQRRQSHDDCHRPPPYRDR